MRTSNDTAPDDETLPPATDECTTLACRRRKAARIAKYAPINDAVKAAQDEVKDLAKMRLRRYSRLTMTAAEMRAEIEHLEYLIALMQTYPDSPQRREGIAYYERELAIAERHAERVVIATRARRRGVDELPGPDFGRAKYVDCVDLIQTLTGSMARKQGSNWVMLCPFHVEDSPSFVIYPPGGGWHCFGCGKGGDAVAFAAEHFQCSMIEGLRWVEELCDVPAS